MDTWKRWLKRAALLGIATIFSIVCLELAFRVNPRLLPSIYLRTLPLAGYDLLYPGVLDGTPIEGVPIPYRFGHSDPNKLAVPQDLVDLGVADPDLSVDDEDYSFLQLPFDRLGLPNSAPWPNPYAVLVGDSFGLAAGVTEPEGLQASLSRETGLSVANVSVPSIGPRREEYLLNEVALERNPKAVVWLFFGGNDVQDERQLQDHLERGKKKYSDLHSPADYPKFFTLDFCRKAAKTFLASRQPKPVYKKPFYFREAKGRSHPTWFYPPYLQALTKSRTEWENAVGWPICQQVFRRVSKELKKREIRFLLVYIPSKCQVYLKHVEPEGEHFAQMAQFGNQEKRDPDSLLLAANNHADALEHLLSDFAAAENIDFLSLTPLMNNLAESGELGYFGADTHWNEKGQSVAVAPIGKWLLAREVSPSPKHRSD